ncbi:hypothetical protein [Tissierella praeacuta]|uniref:hypothetical protein n=1 Tax=Tissierella praeacuta TaxID=43131 RepID=UPI00333F021B
MFNNRDKSKAFWGTVIGTSLGIVISSAITPMSRKRVMKSARKMGANLKDGMSSLWS